eukprot:m.34108 g.34108  ORF g.34108 m.34108 type:complete len:514 (-) comp8671_c0_seq2:2448-3989(-)
MSWVIATVILLLPQVSAGRVAIKTFGKGIPNFPFSTQEQEIYAYNLSASDNVGVINHFWSTGCGGGPIDFSAESGIATYRFYIDGEASASIQFTPRMAVGIHYDPKNNQDPSGQGIVGNRTDEYVVGGRGSTCDEVCEGYERVCNPVMVPAGMKESDVGTLFQRLLGFDTGSSCTIDTTAWWAPDQPSFVWAKNNSNFGKCLGTVNMPTETYCNGSHPLVQRLCRCQKQGNESIADQRSRRSVADEDNNPDAQVPWGTEYIGKTSDMDGYYVNFQIPFYKSVRVTAQLPPGTKPFNVYTIIRGTTNTNPTVNGVPLPDNARLRTYSNVNLAVPSLHFVPILNASNISGVVLAHSVAISGQPQFTFLEGCFHLITPYTLPLHESGVGANFPGVTLSTGMEDYYDSSFYFHAGLFTLPASGVTHMCSGCSPTSCPKSPPHPPCSNSAYSQWSAYRVHAKDPLYFSDGVQLVFRNGDVGAPLPYGSGKCYNLNMQGGPGVTANVSTLAWYYTWEDN